MDDVVDSVVDFIKGNHQSQIAIFLIAMVTQKDHCDNKQ